jgi:hypothetical protein
MSEILENVFLVVLLLLLGPVICILQPIRTFKFFHRYILVTEIDTKIPYLELYKDTILDILEECNLRQHLYTEDLHAWPSEGDESDNIILHFRGKDAATMYTLAIGNTLRDRIKKRGVYIHTA